ncbi:MAG: hypothetical protein ACOY31_01940 [Bacillota bacterium]
MAERCPDSEAGEITLTFLGKDIPAVGPRMKTRCEAILAVKGYVSAIEDMVSYTGYPYRVMFLKQSDGRYMMVIKGAVSRLELMYNFDELTIKRLQRSFRSKMFILTGFFGEGDNPECLALTDGMGAVMYAPDVWHSG